jgi:uncharacterized protein (TIGR02118 family)
MAVKIYAFWSAPRAEEIDDFEAWYMGTHIPLAAALPGQIALVATRTSDLDGFRSPHYRVAEQAFESAEALAACRQTPEWEALLADGAYGIQKFGVTLGSAIGTPDEIPLTATS